MADHCVASEIVSEFFLNTCLLRTPTLGLQDVRAALYCGHIANVHPHDEIETNYIPLVTGSVAEFYIKPMLSCIGDVDVMYHPNTQLAIPRGHPPPTQLPAEYHNYVQVVEIIDSHFPGYVHLPLRYLLTKCNDDDDDKYKAVEYDAQLYIKNDVIPIYSYKGVPVGERHGPASCTKLPTKDGLPYQFDAVPCLRCLQWPPQAANWPTRRRNYGWPDSATLRRVVSNGCDVVGVAHLHCRQDEWMGKHQWRLSFSRAEIVLLNSWMPEQQIVYHILRVYAKAERLTKSADNSKPAVLSNYHVKTLILWACELKPGNWWTDNINLVRICAELLNTLALWLLEARCPHYFVDNSNLIDTLFRPTNARRKLMSMNESRLSQWLVNGYIKKCSNSCPKYVARLFNDIETNIELENAVAEVVLWRLSTVRQALGTTFYVAEFGIPLIMFNRSLTVHSCVCCMTEYANMDPAFSVYFTAAAFLHVAHKVTSTSFSDELMDVLATLVRQFIGSRRCFNQRNSVVLLGKAVKLMSVITTASISTTSLIKIELSKAYLYRALRCKDSDSDSIYCLANVYLAVLYYTTGQYQTAIDHCTLVARLQDHSQCSSHVVQGEILPRVDRNTDNILGLAVFYRYVQSSALSKQHTRHVLGLTTEPFAHYLRLTCLSAVETDEKLTQAAKRQQYTKYISNSQQLFITDVLLFLHVNRLSEHKLRLKSTLHKCQQQSISTTELNTSELVELLQKSAVQHLTTYRQLEARDLSSAITLVTTDYEALCAYKRGDYQQCSQLSTQNVHKLLHDDNNGICVVPTYPEFIQLMDNDIVSLTALMLLLNPECRNPEFIAGKFEDKRDYVCISQLTLSLYLMTQCQLKLHHSVKSVVRTLDYIKVVQRRHPVEWTLDQLTLKLTKRKVLSYIAMFVYL